MVTFNNVVTIYSINYFIPQHTKNSKSTTLIKIKKCN